MKPPAQFIHIPNGELFDFEISYCDNRVPFSSAATETYIVRQSKAVKNALQSFAKAVPGHGAIKRVRRVKV